MNTIINFAPTGRMSTKQLTPYVPISISEILEDIFNAHEMGITMVHLHVRDEKTGAPTLCAKTYGKVVAKIREFAPDLMICVSLSARGGESFEKRTEALFLEGNEKPDMASLTLSSMNFVSGSSINTPEDIQKLTKIMKKQHILPELEVFDLGMINYAKYLIDKNILGKKNYFNIMLGNITSAQDNLMHAGIMINDLPDNSYHSLAGIGSASYPTHLMALASNSGIRVGVEDNIWFDKNRKKLATNSALLERVHQLLKISECQMMTSKELREYLY